MEKSAISGLDIISTSSPMTMGFAADPSFSSLTTAGMAGSPAFRHVACRAKQARFGAIDEVVETVVIDEMDDAGEERVLSESMDSGLEPEDAVLVDGRREDRLNLSMLGRPPG